MSLRGSRLGSLERTESVVRELCRVGVRDSGRDPVTVVHGTKYRFSGIPCDQDSGPEAARKKCRKALFWGISITIFISKDAGVADWPYGHRVGGEHTGYTPILA